MRKRILKTGLLAALLIALLVPLAHLLSGGQGDISANDAAHTVVPMLEMLAVSPTYCAVTEIEPIMELEDAWAVEDTRTESEAPLVTALENFGVPLAYDKNENTFYCSLGLKNGEEWPELKLTAPDASGVSICFSDDYTYDYCADAIAEGYSYELMAYTDTEYSYFYIVFTGLPVVSIRTQEEITLEEGHARFAIGSVDQGSLSCEGLVRLRGDKWIKNVTRENA